MLCQAAGTADRLDSATPSEVVGLYRKRTDTKLLPERYGGARRARLRAENSENGVARTVTLDGELAELMDRRKAARDVKTNDGVMIAMLVFHHNGEPIIDFRKARATACCMPALGKHTDRTRTF